MGKGYLIDSNVIIAYLDNKLSHYGMEFTSTVIDEVPNISVVTQIEVLRFNTTAETYAILEDFVESSVVLNLNDAVVVRTISICKSHKIKLPDAIIAATAIVYNFTLLTRNIGDFKRIDGLNLLNAWNPIVD